MTTKAARIELFGLDTKEEARKLMTKIDKIRHCDLFTAKEMSVAVSVIQEYLEKMLLKFWV